LVLRNEVTGEWKILLNKEMYDVHSLTNITQVIKSRIMKWVGMQHVWGRGEVHTGYWWGNMNERTT
jgi:hypothetical protein